MRHHVVVGALVFAGCLPFDARADDYTYYNTQYQGGNISVARDETPYQACINSIGAPIGATGDFIESARFNSNAVTCRFSSNNGLINVALDYVTGVGSCPGSETFNFERHICGAWPDLAQLYAVTLAFFSWMVLSAGLVIGLRTGQ